jgi:hypothetical protein
MNSTEQITSTGKNKQREGGGNAGRQAGGEQAVGKQETSNRFQANEKHCNLGRNQPANATRSKQHDPVNSFMGSD